MAAAEIFESLCLKLDKALCDSSQAKSQDVLPILDQLNCLNFNIPIIFNHLVSCPDIRLLLVLASLVLFQKACRLIHQFCTLLEGNDDRLTQLCMQLITKLITLQHVVVDGTTLNLSVRVCSIGFDVAC